MSPAISRPCFLASRIDSSSLFEAASDCASSLKVPLSSTEYQTLVGGCVSVLWLPALSSFWLPAGTVVGGVAPLRRVVTPCAARLPPSSWANGFLAFAPGVFCKTSDNFGYFSANLLQTLFVAPLAFGSLGRPPTTTLAELRKSGTACSGTACKRRPSEYSLVPQLPAVEHEGSFCPLVHSVSFLLFLQHHAKCVFRLPVLIASLFLLAFHLSTTASPWCRFFFWIFCLQCRSNHGYCGVTRL